MRRKTSAAVPITKHEHKPASTCAWLLLAFWAIQAACNADIEALRQKGDSEGLCASYEKALSADNREMVMKIASAMESLCTESISRFAVSRYEKGIEWERAMLRPMLADCNTSEAGRMLMAEVLNRLQTGLDPSEIMPILYQVNPGAIAQKTAELIEEARTAARKAQPLVVKMKLDEAMLLARFVGDVEEISKIRDDLLRGSTERQAKQMIEEIVELLRSGIILSADAAMHDLLSKAPADIKNQLQEQASRISEARKAFDNHFLAARKAEGLAKEMALAKKELNEAKKSGADTANPRKKYEELKAKWQTARGDMVVASRNLDFAREKLRSIAAALGKLAEKLP
jgi:hypothetical protein